MNGVEPLSIVCVLKSGGAYNAEYVARLRDGVKKNLQVPYRFMCLSDVPVPAEHIPLKHNWPGWWSKIELFRLTPPVLYFDLDTIIVGDLTDIAAEDSDFVVLRDFYREKGLGSGLMKWNVSLRKLYDIFTIDPEMWMDRMRRRGDQGFIEEHVKTVARWQDKFPGQVVSYKSHVRLATNSHESGNGLPPSDARVICFHGSPKPHEIKWLAA